MNPTLQRFGHPGASIIEYEHWVVLIRPLQVTPYCCVLAARTDALSLAGLSRDEAAELPSVINGFESAVRQLAPAVKFNYLALMMVDPNPHFHAIPRYAAELSIDGSAHRDPDFPRPSDLSRVPETDADTLERWRARLAAHWRR
jgi:diadenosine tetraphosphate (Ap4A) HIT family hydrolase